MKQTCPIAHVGAVYVDHETRVDVAVVCDCDVFMLPVYPVPSVPNSKNCFEKNYTLPELSACPRTSSSRLQVDRFPERGYTWCMRARATPAPIGTLYPQVVDAQAQN